MRAERKCQRVSAAVKFAVPLFAMSFVYLASGRWALAWIRWSLVPGVFVRSVFF